jgi:hypothetical protein
MGGKIRLCDLAAFASFFISWPISLKSIVHSIQRKNRVKRHWSMSTILTARRQLSWPVEAGNEFNYLC